MEKEIPSKASDNERNVRLYANLKDNKHTDKTKFPCRSMRRNPRKELHERAC